MRREFNGFFIMKQMKKPWLCSSSVLKHLGGGCRTLAVRRNTRLRLFDCCFPLAFCLLQLCTRSDSKTLSLRIKPYGTSFFHSEKDYCKSRINNGFFFFKLEHQPHQRAFMHDHTNTYNIAKAMLFRRQNYNTGQLRDFDNKLSRTSKQAETYFMNCILIK